MNDLCRVKCALFSPGLGFFGEQVFVSLSAMGQATRPSVQDDGCLYPRRAPELRSEHFMLLS